MDWYEVDRCLAAQFTGVPRLVGAGFWIPATEPIELAPMLDAALAEDEQDEYGGTFEHWPAHVNVVIEESDARCDEILSCFWSSFPGLSSADGLQLVGVPARSYLCFWTDWGEGHRALALLQPGFDTEVVDDVVEQVLISNGHEFGIGIFGSPPSELSSSISDDVLARAFEAMRDHDEHDEWDEFIAQHSPASEAA